MIVATHWHDDHVKGLSEIVNECSESIFVCSSALLNEEFLTFVKAYDAHTKIEETGVSEFSRILEILSFRSGRNIMAVADRLLLNESMCIEDFNYDVEIYSLSPSDEDFNHAILGLGNLLKEIIGPTRRAIKLHPNNVAVVLDIRISDIKILLGSDLEVVNNDRMGWNAIINLSKVINGSFNYFKIPHHGSANGHHDKLWEKHLTSDSICTLTPFTLGRNNLPTKGDINRICSLSSNFYSTKIKTIKIKRDHSVEKIIKDVVGKSIRLKSFSEGIIRCRKEINNSGENWKIELFDEAAKLC